MHCASMLKGKRTSCHVPILDVYKINSHFITRKCSHLPPLTPWPNKKFVTLVQLHIVKNNLQKTTAIIFTIFSVWKWESRLFGYVIYFSTDVRCQQCASVEGEVTQPNKPSLPITVLEMEFGSFDGRQDSELWRRTIFVLKTESFDSLVRAECVPHDLYQDLSWWATGCYSLMYLHCEINDFWTLSLDVSLCNVCKCPTKTGLEN